MQWLTALLAFAVTMLIFAIIVSTFVEMIHRMFNLRAKGMQLMLENLYEDVIQPYTKSETSKTQFALSIMSNRASEMRGDGKLIAPLPKRSETFSGAGGIWKWLKKLPERLLNSVKNAFDFRLMTDVPVEVFTQKLANFSVIGEAANLTEPMLKDIAQKYLTYGDEIGTYFERRAKLLSVIVAFIVAWVFFVQPYKLATTYVRSPEIAEKVAALAEDVSQQYEEQVKSLEDKVANASEDASEAKAQIEKAVQEFKVEMEKANATVAELQGLGAPVGWPSGEKVVKCGAPAAAAANVDAGDIVRGFCKIKFLVWDDVIMPDIGQTFWLLVGGLLIGLGAPFWAQTVSNLMATRGLTENITKVVKQGTSVMPGLRSAPAPRSLGGEEGAPAPQLPAARAMPASESSPLQEIFELSRRQPKP